MQYLPQLPFFLIRYIWGGGNFQFFAFGGLFHGFVFFGTEGDLFHQPFTTHMYNQNQNSPAQMTRRRTQMTRRRTQMPHWQLNFLLRNGQNLKLHKQKSGLKTVKVYI